MEKVVWKSDKEKIEREKQAIIAKVKREKEILNRQKKLRFNPRKG